MATARPDPPRLIPIAEAAELVPCSRGHLYNRAGQGRITLTKLGRNRTFVYADELARFIAAEAEDFVPGARQIRQRS